MSVDDHCNIGVSVQEGTFMSPPCQPLHLQYSPAEPPRGFPFLKQARAVFSDELGQWTVLFFLLRIVCARGPDTEQNRMVRGDDLLGSGGRATQHDSVLRTSCFRG